MESYVEKIDSDSTAKDSTCNTTYAQVLSKGRSDITDSSNNNPTNLAETVNGNENVATNLDVNGSAINELELPSKNADSSLAELSHSESFEDAEDSQNVDSSSTVKSSDFIQNTSEETSSLVTADDNNSRPNNHRNENHLSG